MSLRTTIAASLCAVAAMLPAGAHAQINQQPAQAAAATGASGATGAVETRSKPVHVNGKASPGVGTASRGPRPYYIEFRARSALSYGHTFAVVARVGQKITAANVVGLHPFTESSVPWVLGHLVPVPSETGFSDGDIEDEYIIARYRVYLTEAEHKELMAYVTKLKSDSPVWHAAVYNCNAFVRDIARHLGLQAPNNFWLLPKEFITELKEMNGGADRLAPRAAQASNRQQ